MTNEIAKTDQSPLAVMLADPAKLAEIPVETVERLYAIDKDIREEGARKEFNAAMVRLQGELDPVQQRGRNRETRSTYALLEDVQLMLDPIINRNGFSYSASTDPCDIADHVYVVLTVRHEGGHTERHQLLAPIDDKGPKGGAVKTRSHGVVSTYSLMTRHLLCRVFGVRLVGMDDDGNAGANVGPSAAKVSDEQGANIAALLDEVGADTAKFREYFGIASIGDLPASRYNEAVRMLERKRQQ